MGFQESIKTVYNKYGDFTGTASKPEFWWFFLYYLIADFLLSIVDTIIFGYEGLGYGPFSFIFLIANIVPNFSVGARRLHDVGRSGWWQLLALTIIGYIILIYWWVQPSIDQNKINKTEFDLPDLNPEEINKKTTRRSKSKDDDSVSGKIKFR